jgi:Ser/Thr protein kinase RdoA (MazF antagonist)
MKPLLIQAGVWESAVALGERLRDRLADPALDRGVCHMDLTLDNVHLIDGVEDRPSLTAGSTGKLPI